MTEPAQPTRLGRFEIIRPLGEGGMGQVYLAKDPTIGREVAVKVINTEIVKGDKGRERFIHEAKAAGSLNHPNLITIHEFGEDQGVLFLVMEHLPGHDLSTLMKRGTLTREEALEVCAQVCDGLASAHERGILHRDVKPSNVRVRLESGRPYAKLMDFGVARVPGSKLTATGDVVGTYAYMAPEYLRGGEATIQTDLYPVGMMLCEALTGELPQMGPTLPQGLAARRRQPEQPHPHAQLPEAVWGLIHKALSPDPANRFPSAMAFSRALRAAIPLVQAPHPPLAAAVASAPTPTEAKPMTIIRTAEPEPARVWPWLLLLAAAGGGFVAWRMTDQPVPQPAPLPVQAAPRPASAVAPPPRSFPAQQATPPQTATQQGPSNAPPQPAAGQAPQVPPTQAAPSQDADASFAREQAQAFAEAYRREDWTRMGRILDDLQARHIEGGDFGRNEEIRQTMTADRSARKIPYELLQRIRAYLPPPPNGGAQGQPGGGQRGPGGN